MICMLMMCVIWSLCFLYFLHPLWLSLTIFLSSITISLFKFFQMSESGMFSYLFTMVYSGGLLLLLVYMSSLVPNSNLAMKNVFYFLIITGILIYCMYMRENFFAEENLFFSAQKLLGMSYFILYKDLIYALILLLLASFGLVSVMMSLLKYPVRSL
uniref:NADH dehydrogenase subunit 6 n=1 Tax=Trichuris suis TaxID=68888 RepID=A0A0M4RFV1_9BILA|nr:NADH dehydrogenase subunit 6 [Trichuris suis]